VVLSRCLYCRHRWLAQGFHPCERGPDCRSFHLKILTTLINVKRQDLYPLAPGFGADCVERVIAHGLMAQDGREELGGMMSYKISGFIGGVCKSSGVGLTKSITGIPLDVPVYLLGYLPLYTPSRCLLNEDQAYPLHLLHGAGMTHYTAKLVSLSRCKSANYSGDLYYLFLKENYSICLLQDRFKIRVEVGNRLVTKSPGHEGLHHITLNGPRPDQGQARYNIFKVGCLQARLKAALGRALQLEDANCLTAVYHLVGVTVIYGNAIVDLLIITKVLDSIVKHR